MTKPTPASKATPTSAKRPRQPVLTAASADRHVLYERSVQNAESEIDFVVKTYKKRRGRRPETLREDFCGTGNTSCEFVRRRAENRAFGLDLDASVLAWGRSHHVAGLTDAQASRVRLLECDVRTPPSEATGTDCVLAMNFSYWCFTTRAELMAYFASVRSSLGPEGVFFLDHYSGSESMEELEERRNIGGFTYVWDQHRYNPVTGAMRCYIHFEFPDGTALRKAFRYDWRLWGLAETVDVLRDAGFSSVTVYAEGEDGEGGGDGVFKASTKIDADPSFVNYIVAVP